MIKKKIEVILFLAGLMWAVHVLDWILPLHLKNYGILPRAWKGLIGIPCSPFLHANWVHLVGNTVPFIVLGLLLAALYGRIINHVLITIALAGGGLVWLLGRTSIHIGASGLIYGMAAFLVVYGFIKRNILSVLISIAVIFLYGGSMLTGMLPFQGMISWESHLFSAAAGTWTAYIFRNRVLS